MSKWHGGKGSALRPSAINPATWEANYERIWGKKKKKGQSNEQAKEAK